MFLIKLFFPIFMFFQLVNCVNLKKHSKLFWLSHYKIEKLQNMENKFPNNFKLKLSLGNLYLASNELEKAQETFDKILTKKLENKENLLYLGATYLDLLKQVSEDKKSTKETIIYVKNYEHLINLINKILVKI